MLALRLDRANIGFRHNYHNLSEAQQRERFSGVQASQPTAPERIDATADWLLRLTYGGRHADLFLQTDAAYQASAIRQTFTSSTPQGTVSIEPFQLSQPRNLVGAEGGATWHLIPLHQKSAAGLRLLTSVRFETELASPLVAFQARDGFLSRPLPRRNALFGKAGLRFDGRQSWLETGIQSGPFNQITSLTLGTLTCTPGNIGACVAPPGAELPGVADLDTRPLAVQTLRRNQSGVFLNARIHLPLLEPVGLHDRQLGSTVFQRERRFSRRYAVPGGNDTCNHDPDYGQFEHRSESGSVLLSEQSRGLAYSRVSNFDHGTIPVRVAYGASIPVRAEIPESADPVITNRESGLELFSGSVAAAYLIEDPASVAQPCFL